jgi:hypothetical protein
MSKSKEPRPFFFRLPWPTRGLMVFKVDRKGWWITGVETGKPHRLPLAITFIRFEETWRLAVIIAWLNISYWRVREHRILEQTVKELENWTG